MSEQKELTATISGAFKIARGNFTLDTTFDLPGKGITGILGHSGSGKTTLLRCIAGLEKADQGTLTVMGEPWQSKRKFVPTHKRPVGMVFQEASLFPHLTGQENIHYAVKRAPKNTDNPIAYGDLIALLGLTDQLDQYPHEMSGGERQRFAIARALMIKPKLLLMDEPLASLDLARKQEILPYLETLKAELDLPVLYVSHSPDEIIRLADHLLVLDQGKTVASGPLQQTLARLDFPIPLGEDRASVVEGSISRIDNEWHLTEIAFGDGPQQIHVWVRDSQIKHGPGYRINDPVRIRILAKDVSIALEKHEDSSILNIIPGQIEEIEDNPDTGLALVKIDVQSTPIIARVTLRSLKHLGLTPEQRVWLQIKSAALVR